MNIVLDCNIYDKLAETPKIQQQLRCLISDKALTIIATRCLWDEIEKSSHVTLAKSLPVTFVGESVMFVDGSVDDRLGSGELYDAHRGSSNQHNDALIVDAAEFDADFLVSEDGRLRRRMNEHAIRCKAISFSDFQRLLGSLPHYT
jgi:predicted nucleic acid-binding protein